MKKIIRLAVAICACIAAGSAAAVDIDLTGATCAIGDNNRVRLGRTSVSGYQGYYDIDLAWDGVSLGFAPSGASASRAAGTVAEVAIDLTSSTCELAGSKAFVLRNISLPGIAGGYWIRLAWDGSAVKYKISDYGAEISGGMDKKYLLAFHACTACTDYRTHVTYLVQSSDGKEWTLPPGFSAWEGSVPDVIRRGNSLYMYNPGNVRRYRFATNTWETAGTPVSIRKSDGSKVEFVDPSAILDDEGRIVLFYLDSTGSREDPATCVSGVTACTKGFGSAVEVAGSDGTSFVAQSGNRVEVTLDRSNGKTDFASDPDIFRVPGGYVVYISRGNNVQAFTSPTLHGSYAAISGLTGGYLHSSNEGGVPAGFYNEESGEYWTLVHKGTTGPLSILRAVTPSLNTPLNSGNYSVLLTGGSSYSLASPSFALNRPY